MNVEIPTETNKGYEMNFDDIKTDTESVPITGYLPDGRYIDIPLISHVEDNLYVGGCIHGVDLGDFFSHIFSFYKWERYGYDASKTKLYEYTMYDSHDGLDLDTIDLVVPLISEALDNGGNVLVHCQAGINRSNLVAASVLMSRGLSARAAVELLRKQRSELVLANTTFLNHLLNQDK